MAFRSLRRCSTAGLFAARMVPPFLATRAVEHAGYAPMMCIRAISIPVDRIDFNFARSSGPGGQNVNKVNTKAELRFHVLSADWIPEEVKYRLMHLQRHRINNDGELVLTSQEARTQVRNRELVLAKLKEALAEAEQMPKERHIWEGIGDRGRAERRAEKTHRKDIKANRGRNNSQDFD